MLEFEGRIYTTISDITKRFPISEKKLKQLIRDKILPEPEEIRHGTRTFRHYSEDWQAQLANFVAPRRGVALDGGSNG